MVNITEKYAAMPSRKHSGRRPRTQILAVHSAEAPLERGYAKSLTNWSNTSNVQASWNAFADPGILVRAVNTYNAAWHASWANSLSIGYETAAYAAYGRDKWMSLEGRRMLERLAIEMAADAKIFDIPLRWLTGAQVNAVRAGNTNIKGLAAHRQIDPAHRTDPGDGFPYGYLLKRIKAHTAGIKPAAANGPDPIQEDDMPSAKEVAEENWDVEIGLGKDKFQTGSYLLWTHNNTGKILDRISAQNAQIEGLAGAVVALSKGEDLDVDKLLAGIEAAARRGVETGFESVTRTETVTAKVK